MKPQLMNLYYQTMKLERKERKNWPRKKIKMKQKGEKTANELEIVSFHSE